MPDSPALSSLTAGPELDKLIGERVFGLQGIGYYGPTRPHGMHEDYVQCPTPEAAMDLYRKHWHPAAHPTEVELCSWKEGWGPQFLPDYSTSIEAAWQVVEKMADWQGGGVFYFRLEQSDADDASREWGAQFYAWGASEPCQAPMVLADTPALAICQAALIAIGDAHV